MNSQRTKPASRVVGWIGLSLVVHAAVVAAVVASWEPTPLPRGVVSASGDGDGGPQVDLPCLVDEALVAAARASTCLVPGTGDRGACLDEATGSFSTRRLACVNMASPIDLAMLEPVELVPGATLDTSAQEKELEEKVELAEKELENPPTDATQIVDTGRPAVEVPPEDADFLAEYDSKVEKQTVHKGKPADVVTPGTTGPDQRGVLAPQPEQPNAPTKESPPGKLGMRGPASQGKAGGSEIASATGNGGTPDGLVPDEAGNAPKRGLGVAIDPTSPPGGGGGGGGGDGRPGKPVDLRPGSQEAIARASGGTYDKLDDIDEGAETLLNTKRFKYASFFNRIKRAVWENWHADSVYAMRDPDGKIYGIKDRLTVLKVSLHPDGRLANVIVEQPCGVDFLDDEAVSAFRKAAPFPNPPKGLVDQTSQLITFRFGFTLEIQDRPSWKIVKYQ